MLYPHAITFYSFCLFVCKLCSPVSLLHLLSPKLMQNGIATVTCISAWLLEYHSL